MTTRLGFALLLLISLSTTAASAQSGPPRGADRPRDLDKPAHHTRDRVDEGRHRRSKDALNALREQVNPCPDPRDCYRDPQGTSDFGGLNGFRGLEIPPTLRNGPDGPDYVVANGDGDRHYYEFEPNPCGGPRLLKWIPGKHTHGKSLDNPCGSANVAPRRADLPEEDCLSKNWDAFAGRAVIVPAQVDGKVDFGKDQVSCMNGVFAKCAVVWRYWRFEPESRPGVPADPTVFEAATRQRKLFQACVRAAKADYCGTGESFTCDGTTIDVADGEINVRDRRPGDVLEADWDESGATCLDVTRLRCGPPATTPVPVGREEDRTRALAQRIAKHCNRPRLMKPCEPGERPANGALLRTWAAPASVPEDDKAKPGVHAPSFRPCGHGVALLSDACR